MKRLEDLDLNLLLLLHWLLEERSVTRAAARVSLSQPAASRGLQRLREAFGDELLVRSGRKLTPSRLAMSLQPDLTRAVQHLRIVALTDENFDPKTSSETVVIACNDYLSAIGTQAWVDAISPVAPKMRSNWRALDLTVMDALGSGQVDLVIIPEAAMNTLPKSALSQDMVVKPLLNDRFVVFGAVSHPAILAETLSVDDFAAVPQVLVSPAGEGPGFIDRVLASHDLKRHIAHRTASFHHAADLAVATGGLTVIPERLARLKVNGAFRALPFAGQDLTSHLVWHASRTSDKAHVWVRRQLQAYFSP